jgi:hypothetical protein
VAHFRLEADYDEASGLYYAEVFYPPDSTEPRMRTKAIFLSKEHALEEAMRLLEREFGQPARPLKPN